MVYKTSVRIVEFWMLGMRKGAQGCARVPGAAPHPIRVVLGPS